jgi:nucleotide-binding universal stress UspA family protein
VLFDRGDEITVRAGNEGIRFLLVSGKATEEPVAPPEGRKTLKTKTAVRIGKAYQQIIQLAVETQADMVAMGVRGRGALDLAVFGSTTYRVMQLGPCPVPAVHV